MKRNSDTSEEIIKKIALDMAQERSLRDMAYALAKVSKEQLIGCICEFIKCEFIKKEG